MFCLGCSIFSSVFATSAPVLLRYKLLVSGVSNSCLLVSMSLFGSVLQAEKRTVNKTIGSNIFFMIGGFSFLNVVCVCMYNR